MATQPNRNGTGQERYQYQKMRASERRLQFDLDPFKELAVERRLPACTRCSVKHEEHDTMGCARYTETRLTC